jgi:hypothetical protein
VLSGVEQGMGRLVAVAVVAAAVASACGGGSSPGSEPLGTVTFTVGGAATTPVPGTPGPPDHRDVFAGAPLGRWRLGPPTDLPPGIAVYYQHAGYATEGGPGASHRALGLADGGVDIVQLRPALPATGQSLDYFEFSMAADEDFRTVFVGVCIQSSCGYIDTASPDSEAVLYRSSDGGITWEEYGDLARDWRVSGVLDEDTAILRYHGPGSLNGAYRLHPAASAYEPPADESGYPREIPGWGTAYLVGTDDDGHSYVEYHLSDANNRWHYIARMDPQGTVVRAWLWDVTEFARPVAVVAPGLLIGSVLVDERADGEDGRFYHVEVALLDMETGVASPIPALSAGLTGNSHPWVTQIVVDDLLAVDAPGGCLNVRDAPTITGLIVHCYPDGVLLREHGAPVTAESSEWLRVEGPDGRDGWAVGRFLLR